MLTKGKTEEEKYQITRMAVEDRGRGTFVWPDGSRYEGELYHGCLQGYGTFKWPDGSFYRGEWKNNLPHGRGVFKWADGNQFEGEWEEGEPKTEATGQGAGIETLDKVEEEARLKAEEEARRKAAEEARRKAEEEARLKAEEEASRGGSTTQGGRRGKAAG